MAWAGDLDTLMAISPEGVYGYLLNAGWAETARIADKAAVLRRPTTSGEPAHVTVPLRSDLRDYAERLGDVIERVARAAGRSELSVLADLQNAASDTIRIPLSGHGVSLNAGVEVVSHAKAMVSAAARSVRRPEAWFGGDTPKEVGDYLESVQFGQTERSSYVYTLLSPVPASLEQLQLPGTPAAHEDVPFGRQVTETLGRALGALGERARAVGPTGPFDSFKEIVGLGVSANLCDAVAKMGSAAGGESLSVSLAWASTRPAPADVPRAACFAGTELPTIEGAGDFLKSEPPEAMQIRGYVWGLRKEEGLVDLHAGWVTIRAMIDDQERRVRVRLTGEEHHSATAAYDRDQRVRCYGTLVRKGNTIELRDTYGFSVDDGAS